MKKSRIASRVPHPESSLRHLPLVDLLVDTKTDARGGSDGDLRAAVCARARAPASRAGTTRSEVVLGGQKGQDFSARACGRRLAKWRRRFRPWRRRTRSTAASSPSVG